MTCDFAGRMVIRMMWAGFAATVLIAAPTFAEDQADPSLDELLGLDEAPRTEPAPGDIVPDQFKSPEAVQPVPGHADPVDLLKDVVREMDQVTEHFEKNQDAGPIPQRKQKDIILKLEQLIAVAKQQSSSSSSSSSGSPQQGPPSRGQGSEQMAGQQSGQQPGEQRMQEANGSEAHPGGFSPGGLGDAVSNNSELEETGREWGNLRPRDRKELHEGLSEEFSPVYRNLTERFYERIAGENQ